MSDTSKNGPDRRIKVIAMYFPQLHAIPENDEWWGEGFTDWENVRKAAPLYEGHKQPRIPLDEHYYDQSRLETLHWQIDLASKYGIYGFCHYHYWFDGKQLLETPTRLMLETPDLNMPFCLSWANETWSRRWHGRNQDILIRQTHPADKSRWKLHFDYLIKAWSDDRAIKIDGKPVFIIYRPQNIDKINEMLDYWRELAYQAGLADLYFIAQKAFEFPRRECLKNFDAVFQFQPSEAIYAPGFEKSNFRQARWFGIIRALPESMQDKLRNLYAKYLQKTEFYEYDRVWRQITTVNDDPELTTYPGAFADWDNTPRYREKAKIFTGADPGRFEYWFGRLLESMTDRKLPENLIFFNAWNEWAEGAYLEPDQRHGYAYLEAISRQLTQNRCPPGLTSGECRHGLRESTE